jgi:hypothetical protein
VADAAVTAGDVVAGDVADLGAFVARDAEAWGSGDTEGCAGDG